VKLTLITSILISSAWFNAAFSQGCSDAGFCSAGSLKSPSGTDSVLTSTASVKAVYGLGEQGVVNVQLIPEVDIRINTKSSIQASVPFVFASGDLGSTNGVGDVILSYSISLPEKNNFKYSFTAGTRLPTGTTNHDYKSMFSLPMPYQTGLGTVDLIVGASARYKKWNAAVGYQKVIYHNNNNDYLHYSIIVDNESQNDYFESRNLKRGDDVLIRAGRLFAFRKITFTPGVLAIYRVNKDKITNISGKEIALDGSDGLTLNITGTLLVPAGNSFSFLAEAGAPVIVRDTRADGLTRSMVMSLAVRYHF